MNVYFWCFALYALWITPIGLEISLRAGRDVRWRIRVQAAGLSAWSRTQSEEDMRKEQPVDGRETVRRMLSPDAPELILLWREGHIRRFLKAWHLQSLYLHARISQPDAAQTAMLFASARVLLQALLHAPAVQKRLHGSLQADFQARGSQLFLRCIVTARLGNLVAAALRLAVAACQIHSRLSAKEEESYAASH